MDKKNSVIRNDRGFEALMVFAVCLYECRCSREKLLHDSSKKCGINTFGLRVNQKVARKPNVIVGAC